MLTFWSNCKLGVKLQAAFALVMLTFIGALVAMFVANAKITALTTLQTTRLVPARAAANQPETYLSKADDSGAYYVMERRPAVSAQYLAAYRRNLATFQEKLKDAETFANDDVQRSAIADIHNFVDGPQAYYQGNEDSFKLRASGNYLAAQRAFTASTPEPTFVAAQKYLDNIRQYKS